MLTRQARRSLCWRLTIIGLALVSLGSCGIKGPPVAPRVQRLPIINDLQGRLQDDTVLLTWQHGPEYEAVSGYVVLRAQSALSRPECPRCPLIFQKVDTIRVDRQTQSVHFSQAVPSGFRYTYKIRPFQSSGAQGPDSNAVVLEAAP